MNASVEDMRNSPIDEVIGSDDNDSAVITLRVSETTSPMLVGVLLLGLGTSDSDCEVAITCSVGVDNRPVTAVK